MSQTLAGPPGRRRLIADAPRLAHCAGVALLLLAFLPSRSPADAGRPAPEPDSAARLVRAVPDPRGHGDMPRRLLMGEGYRDLWMLPVRAPVLDSSLEAGGAAPLDSSDVGRALVLIASDSARYLFRPLAHGDAQAGSVDPGAIAMSWLNRDQQSAWHPAGPLIAGAVLEAAGVLPERPRLVVFPSDTMPGADRASFAGRLGIVERLPQAGSAGNPGYPAGAAEILGTPALLERTSAGPADRIDARAYLAARLMNFVLDEADPAPWSWTWAGYDEDGRRIWRPVPALPARAFARSGGLLHDLPSEAIPRRHGRSILAPDGGAGSAGAFDATDRRCLAELDRAAWDSVAAGLVARLNDAVLGSSVRAMPPEMQPTSAREILVSLRHRRDKLRRFAAAEYARLSEAVDVRTTQAAELVTIARPNRRQLEISIAQRDTAGPASSAPYFHRVIEAAETREVRVYLLGGNDRVVACGPARPRIAVRIIEDGHDAEIADSSLAGDLHLYSAGGSMVVNGSRRRVDRLLDPPAEEPSQELSGWTRDYGGRNAWARTIEPSSDRGLLVGGRIERETYGFEQRPYASRSELGARYSLTLRGAELIASHEMCRANSRLSGGARIDISGLDVSRFYGFGNATPDTSHVRDAYDVRQTQVRLQPFADIRLTTRAVLQLATPIKFVYTGQQSPQSVLAAVQPYGVGHVREVGGQAGLFYGADAPGRPGEDPNARASVRGHAVASYFPVAGPASDGFGSMEGEIATRFDLAAIAAPRLVLRAGGKKLWGRYPFFEAAFLGGSGALPGTREQRFAGDASVFGGSELRIRILRNRHLIAGELGLLGLADAGRVFLSGENAPQWHGATGGGLWYAPRGGRDMFSLMLVNSGGHTRLSTRGGFSF